MASHMTQCTRDSWTFLRFLFQNHHFVCTNKAYHDPVYKAQCSGEDPRIPRSNTHDLVWNKEYRACIQYRNLLHHLTDPAFVLTTERVGEAVPHAAPFPYEPPSLRAGREAERSPQYAHQQVADGNVHQEQVDGRPQHLVAAEKNKHQQVVNKSESADKAQAHSHYQVPSRGESGPVWSAPQVPFPGSGTQSAVEIRAAAQAHVGHDHGSPGVTAVPHRVTTVANISSVFLFFLLCGKSTVADNTCCFKKKRQVEPSGQVGW